jgi:hypothetical protein
MSALTKERIEKRLLNRAKRTMLNSAKSHLSRARKLGQLDDIKVNAAYHKPSMRWYPRLGVFKSSNGKNYFNPVTMTATSYGWWAFLKRINGKIVFNDYRYSNQTSGHQSQLRGVLHTLGIKIDGFVAAPSGLGRLDTAMEHESYVLAQMIVKFENCQKKFKRQWQKEIDAQEKRIDFLRSLGVKKVSKAKMKELLGSARLSRKSKLERAKTRRAERREMELMNMRITSASNAKQRISSDVETPDLTDVSTRPTLRVINGTGQ